jgi:hypothetical protein
MPGPVIGTEDFVEFMTKRASRLRNYMGPGDWARIRSVSSTRLSNAIARLRDLMMRQASLPPAQVGHRAEIQALQGQIQRAMVRAKARTQVMRVAGSTARRGAAQTAARQGFGTALRAAAPALAHPVTVMAVVAIVLVGIALTVRSGGFEVAAPGVDPMRDIRFVGPAPNDECAEDVFGSRGFLWVSDTEGWRAPNSGADYVEPIQADFQDTETGEWDLDGYQTAMNEWQARMEAKLAPAVAEARTDCGEDSVGEILPPGIAWPIIQETCFFMPAETVGVPADAAINDSPDMSAICVKKDNLGLEGVKLWAEIIAYPDPIAAMEHASGYGGPREDVDVGDWAVIYHEDKRDVMVGTVGPLLYYLYACSRCEPTWAPRLPSLAEEIVANYLVWEGENL